MADNVPITAGAGTDVATDQVSGTNEHVQLFKLAYSADGVRTLVPVDADGVLVNLGANNDVTVASLPLPSGAATAALQTQPGVDIGDVTVNNAPGASAVNIQDGGNTITVDGIVTGVVVGPEAEGAAATSNPVRVAGVDGSGNLQTVATDTDGNLQVEVLALPTATISNTAFAVTKTALTGSAPATATVGTSSAQAVASNSNRKGLVLTNTHATARISFGIGQTAVLDSGITLWPRGVWVMDEFTFATSAINAIASAASTTLGIQELT